MLEDRVYIVVPHTVQLTNGDSKIIPCGMAAAQASHAIAELQDSLKNRPLGHMTTIILGCRDSQELEHVIWLLSMFSFSWAGFYDYNDRFYGLPELVRTAVAFFSDGSEPNPAAYLPLWSCQ